MPQRGSSYRYNHRIRRKLVRYLTNVVYFSLGLMNARTCVGALMLVLTSVSFVRAEGIDRPSPELLQFMRNADQVFIFSIHTRDKPRRDDKHMRVLEPRARRDLIRLLGHPQKWYMGADDRFGIGPPPKDIGLLFRSGRNELILFFSPGELIDARYNGQRQPTRWSPGEGSYEGVENWKARYAKPELSER